MHIYEGRTAVFGRPWNIAEGRYIIDDTDGCAKQFRSGTALYLNSLLATTHGVILDRAVGAPGHRKEIVDDLNAVDKQFIAETMALIVTPTGK
jgi:hypothetical protein